MLHLDTGNTGFMILCTSLVMLMTPGLAFFYGGLVGRKNVLAIMIQSFVSMGWTTVIWYLYGYSLCFSGDWHGIIGNLHHIVACTVSISPHLLAQTTPFRQWSSLPIRWSVCRRYSGPHLGCVHQPCDLQGLLPLPDGVATGRVLSPGAHGVGQRLLAKLGV